MPQPLIPTFTRLNPITSFYRSSQKSTPPQDATTTTTPPDLIILCSWMGAASKHIEKYTRGWQTLFPGADILLLESTLSGMLLGSDLSAASDYLLGETTGKRKVVCHIFSNGGARNATALAPAASYDAMILDSCPGRGKLRATAQAISFSLPPPPARTWGYYLIYLLLLLFKLLGQTLGKEDPVAKIRRDLLDATLFPNKEMRRLYLYSEKDALVDYRDVRGHVEEAEKGGGRVREEVFRWAPHCALVSEDAGRYWGAVREVCLAREGK